MSNKSAQCLTRFFQKQWQKLSLWHVLLIPLSWIFGLLTVLRLCAYRLGIFKSFKLAVPVIVVGNISVGGTGKTPLVIWLAKALRQAGFNPAIVSRGYGARFSGEVTSQSNPFEVGDEPVLLAKRSECKVWVGRNRVAAAQDLVKKYPECNVIISDDGLQHYRMQRDIEIAVVDGQKKFGTGYLLPAGPLREPVSRLAYVDIIVQHGDSSTKALSNSQTYLMQLEPLNFYQLSNHVNKAVASDFVGKSIVAIAGIGNPNRFFEQLSAMGLLFKSRAYDDHYAFQAADLHELEADIILMTEKDAVKCASFSQTHWWCLSVQAKVDASLATSVIELLRK